MTLQTTTTDRYAVESTSRIQHIEFPEGWVPHVRPEFPTGFTKKTFILPEHETRLSQVLNKHPRDDHIRFDEEPHLYYVDGIVCTRSVTGLVHRYCQEFVESEGLATMKRGKNWPQPKYANQDQITWRIVACEMALQAVKLEKKGSRVRLGTRRFGVGCSSNTSWRRIARISDDHGW